MRVSVVMATRDRPDHLRAALAAVVGAIRPDDEVVVVDSASVDPRVRDVVQPPVRYVRCDRPGASVARNVGVAEATGDVVAFCDDDCRPRPGWAAALAAAFERDPSLVFVTGAVAGPQISTEEVDAGPWTAVRDPMHLGHGANWACRRDAFVAVGGFDETMGPGARLRAAEDHDLFWRLLVAGGTGRHVADAVVDHPSWRRTLDLVRTEWAYGVGSGALAMKARRLEVGGPTLRNRLWDEGLVLTVRLARRGWERPALRQLVRVAGVLAGAARARSLAIGPDRRFSPRP